MGIDPKPRMIGKIEIICDRVVRGGHAVNIWQVHFHRYIRILSIVLTTLGSAGMVAVNVKPDFGQQHGWALVGSLLALLLSIFVQLSSEFGIDRRATLATSARDSFRLVDAKLEIVLRNEDPTDMVNKLLEETDSLLVKFYDVVPERSDDSSADSKRKSDALVDRFAAHWNLPPARRRPRNTPLQLPPAEEFQKPTDEGDKSL
jgi:hypothetical protein